LIVGLVARGASFFKRLGVVPVAHGDVFRSAFATISRIHNIRSNNGHSRTGLIELRNKGLVPPGGIDHTRAQAAPRRIRERRKGVKLGRLKIKDLINEGRR
jgi:hypothetical protein